jgi:Family of unknown function (DUF6263)
VKLWRATGVRCAAVTSPTKISFALFLLLAACSHGGDKPAASTTPAAPPTPPPPAATPDEAPTVKLLAPGDEPRQQLRFKVKKGQTGTLIMTMRFNVEIAVGGNTVSKSKLPPIELPLDIRVTDVTADGDIRYDFTIGAGKVLVEPGSDPNVVKAMQQQLETTKNIPGHALVTSRGFTKEADFDVPANIDPTMRQTLAGMKESLKQIAAPFPEEAVGRGARWQVDSNVHQNGMSLKQTAVYQITSVDKERVSCVVTLDQSADPQDVPLPAAGPTAKMHLLSMKSSGQGTTQVVLSLPAAAAARIELNSDMRANIEANGQQQEMTMKMGVGMEIRAK